MKRISLLFLSTLVSLISFSQKIDGQWRGYFDNNGDISVGAISGTNKIEYVLELEIDGTKVSGYSYTYFNYYPEKYYVICEVVGTYDSDSKLITAHEKKRIKGYTPQVGWDDCLQTHVLTYYKQGTKELLEGTWRKSPYEDSDCGVGKTTLQRKVITNAPIAFNKKDNRTVKIPQAKTQQPKAVTVKPKVNTNPPVVKTQPVKPKNTVVVTPEPEKKEIAKTDPPKKKEATSGNDINNYEKRNNKLVQTIDVKKETIKVEFYDNGDIDGDTISVFFNGKLLLAHKKLTSNPLTITINADELQENNELVMYAENLGDIPPNTAVMVVTTGSGKRYEVRIASDLKQSGTIKFVHKPGQ